MADNALTSSLITIAQEYQGDVIRQIPRRAITVALVAPTFREGFGPNIAWAPELGTSNSALVETYSEGADATNFGDDSQNAATVSWSRYRANWHVTGTAIAIGAASRTPARNVELWANQYVNAIMALIKQLNIDIYTGSGGNALVGLATAIDNTATYAGITRQGANPVVSGAYTVANGWSSYVYDSSTNPGAGANLDGSAKQALTFGQIRYDQAQIQIACGEKPDLALCNLTTLNWLRGLFDPNMFYMMGTELAARVGVPVRGGPSAGNLGTNVMLDAGVGRLHFDGTWFVADPDCPAGTIYYVNTGYWKFEGLEPVASLDIFPTDDEALSRNTLFDGFEEMPMSLVLQLLSVTGDSFKAMLKAYPQIAITRPNSCGKRINITATG